MAPATIDRLVSQHGSGYGELLALIAADPELGKPLVPQSKIIGAEVKFAVRNEMAQTLADVVFRRTSLGAIGYPGRPALLACAQIMASELNWSQAQCERQLNWVETAFVRHGALQQATPYVDNCPI